ncbi:phospho-N-acetylmuramoyl-pentapeptide-transferase [Sharpea porci]|uniref:phospho-N-acetylmuramoyl-pentapeptide- transferase n=1 Tax=Sharpea porci TaxID=2652286 RepID=UPI002A917717|nr:phospho-N-acetylmuramoyl-pentapeptide-transferase [Sharpea porci]MDY5279652.1 phospho-N-acetylmuramoyl-pentapeptide-transferase [Sharpea porci]
MTTVKMILSFAVAMILMLIVMPKFIPYLHKLKFGQVEREEGLASHKKKGGTPTMGGLAFIIVSAIVTYVLNISFIQSSAVNLLIFALVSFGFIGFIDDFLIVVRHSNIGLKPAYKYGLQSVFAIAFYFLAKAFLPGFTTEVTLHFMKTTVDFGWFYPVLVYFMFTAESNAVNLTDGLDGLATGISIIAIAPFILFALMNKQQDVAITAVTLIGALVGFLYFNYHPARIFMGDCGSLALGGFLAAIAIITKQELLLLIVGIVPLLETLSVIIQVVSYKTRKKRVFKMAPIHHHFEMCGWSEVKVVVVFYGVGFIAGIVGILLGVM